MHPIIHSWAVELCCVCKCIHTIRTLKALVHDARKLPSRSVASHHSSSFGASKPNGSISYKRFRKLDPFNNVGFFFFFLSNPFWPSSPICCDLILCFCGIFSGGRRPSRPSGLGKYNIHVKAHRIDHPSRPPSGGFPSSKSCSVAENRNIL